MDELIVRGPTPLRGQVEVPGAKNSISKLLVASMLTDEPCTFSNAPRIGDTAITLDICRALGTVAENGGRRLRVRTPVIAAAAVPVALARQNRLSVMMLAPLLHRGGAAVIPAAGGDRIGPRPVDFHLDAYRAMGACVDVGDDMYRVRADRLRGADITLPYPSVTATENVLMAATLAKGRTCLRNAAVEPEILDLVLFLQKMGAVVDCPGERTFVVEGVGRLSGASHTVMPDRLVAASLGAAAIASGGDVFVRGARHCDLVTFLNTLRRVGAAFEAADDGIRFRRNGALRPIALQTAVHPGFMTDWQPPLAILLLQAEGMSVIHETVFEDRFVYVDQLKKMGADVELYDTCLGNGDCRFRASAHRHSVVIRGPTRLRGACLDIPDLRAGFCHLIAAVVADGESRLRGVEQLDRGYERIDQLLAGLGADIRREPA